MREEPRIFEHREDRPRKRERDNSGGPRGNMREVRVDEPVRRGRREMSEAEQPVCHEDARELRKHRRRAAVAEVAPGQPDDARRTQAVAADKERSKRHRRPDKARPTEIDDDEFAMRLKDLEHVKAEQHNKTIEDCRLRTRQRLAQATKQIAASAFVGAAAPPRQRPRPPARAAPLEGGPSGAPQGGSSGSGSGPRDRTEATATGKVADGSSDEDSDSSSSSYGSSGSESPRPPDAPQASAAAHPSAYMWPAGVWGQQPFGPPGVWSGPWAGPHAMWPAPPVQGYSPQRPPAWGPYQGKGHYVPWTSGAAFPSDLQMKGKGCRNRGYGGKGEKGSWASEPGNRRFREQWPAVKGSGGKKGEAKEGEGASEETNATAQAAPAAEGSHTGQGSAEAAVSSLESTAAAAVADPAAELAVQAPAGEAEEPRDDDSSGSSSSDDEGDPAETVASTPVVNGVTEVLAEGDKA